MNTASQLQMFFSTFVTQIPTLLVCGVGFLMLLSRGREVGSGKAWALFGFGLGFALSIVIPLSQVAFQASVRSGSDPQVRMWIMSGMSMVWSVLRAVSYACILAALLARRPVSSPPIHPYVDGSFPG